MGISISHPLVPRCLSSLCWTDLEDNLEVLQIKIQELNAMRNDLLRWVLKEELRGLQRLQEVNGWFLRVGEIESKANRLLDDSISVIQRISMYGYCSLFSASDYKYNKDVATMLRQVEILKSEGAFEVVVKRALPKKKMSALYPIVSQEKLLAEAWDHLEDRNIRTLGLHGKGGIGKTTLLTQISDKLKGDAYRYDHVIFVSVVCEEIESIQNEIAKKLGLCIAREWRRKSKMAKASELYHFLDGKKFVLLLDDTQSKTDLEKIGVPLPTRENGCKIVYTTRDPKPYGNKWVDALLEVTCLNPQEAWEFFEAIVGETTLIIHPEIPKLARIIAEKCRGVPSLLKVIGETMAGKKTILEWRDAVHALVSSSAKISDMEEDMSYILKFNYETLPGKERSCFLYYDLFPKDAYITRQDLVDSWVCERLVSNEIKGYEMISDLVRRGLLVENKSEYGVKMHEVFRKMDLWIASDHRERYNENLVVKGGNLQQILRVTEWNMITEMSGTSTRFKNISDPPQISKLTTLFLQENTEFVELPEEVSSLVSLRLLNLSRTSIRRLPHGLKELKRLIHLNLEYTSELKEIEVIAHLLNLKVLRLFRSVPMDLKLMLDIQLFQSLQELSLTVKEDATFQQLLSTHRLASCIRRLHLNGKSITNRGMSLLIATFSLRQLYIDKCDILEITIDQRSSMIGRMRACFGSIEEIPQFRNIRKVYLRGCKVLSDLTWMLFSPSLAELRVTQCFSIKEIISKEKAMAQLDHTIAIEQPFQNLTNLSLDGLPKLESIYWTPLLFPVLEYIQISECPKLRRLPFNSESAKEIEPEVKLDDNLILHVDWEDEATAERFSELNNR